MPVKRLKTLRQAKELNPLDPNLGGKVQLRPRYRKSHEKAHRLRQHVRVISARSNDGIVVACPRFEPAPG